MIWKEGLTRRVPAYLGSLWLGLLTADKLTILYSRFNSPVEPVEGRIVDVRESR
jgi:hypothetical protein